jgi:hypothetical protein
MNKKKKDTNVKNMKRDNKERKTHQPISREWSQYLKLPIIMPKISENLVC